ncbi:MAG: dynamin family protein [Thermodesulfobacteriota bacterium]|nr:dynamin family protein [Thermodesulfobacteriota bacterium]
MYTENYINSLQAELLELVENRLTPAALRYGYSDSPLETNIKWRPLVLIVGNYSSGKSTLINDFLGADIQATGQAPTDDSFTVLTCDETALDEDGIRVTDQRDGKFLLANKDFPFEGLKKHGQQFAAHFCMKKVNAPFLKHFAIIDTPGMLDSITERDRGYDYQKVIGDLAHIADLVLVLFDPHKAGTVREAHISLRDTLPAKTFEDRVLFVLNRIDECASLNDLLRVYGTLCWNLSQITGRKDIPPIRLTYSQRAAAGSDATGNPSASYLSYLENQREELKAALMQAPRYHLDHLATFLEVHSERLAHLLEALVAYGRNRRTAAIKFTLTGLFVALLTGAGGGFAMFEGGLAATPTLFYISAGFVTTAVFMLWITILRKYFIARFHKRQLKLADSLTPLENQYRKETWQAVKKTALNFLKSTGGRFSLGMAKQEYAVIDDISTDETREVREALNEISALKNGEAFDPSSAYQAFLQRKAMLEAEEDGIP